MRVLPVDRDRFQRQVEALRAVDDADELTAVQVSRVLAGPDADNADPPELELHRRGRALGMARPGR